MDHVELDIGGAGELVHLALGGALDLVRLAAPQVQRGPDRGDPDQADSGARPA